MNRLFVFACLLVLVACTADKPEEGPPPMSVTRTLGNQETEGYERAWQVKDLTYPADHGSHPGFKNEWWYVTGNLENQDGRPFGFQFTLFRSALAPPDPGNEDRTSAWATRQAFLAHTALSDIEARNFHHDERYSRGAMGLAGASSAPFKVWLDDWVLREVYEQNGGCDACFSTLLSASAVGYDLSLRLSTSDRPVLHGNRGLSAKSNTPGNASYYYSYTRLDAEGEITVDGTVHQVRGQAWFDHEWSTSALEEDQAGWDWFSLQLSDGSELMLFQLRSTTDGDAGFLKGTRVSGDGSTRALQSDDFSIVASASWVSKAGARYPAAWKISVPEEDLNLSVRSALPDQEIDASFRYWEGAVTIEGKSRDRTVSGKGYVELTGYEN